MEFLKKVKPMLSDLNTYLTKVQYYKGWLVFNCAANLRCCCVELQCRISLYFQAIPDTKLTIKRYADAKFEYLVRFLIYERIVL